jgi:hypothetical protein
MTITRFSKQAALLILVALCCLLPRFIPEASAQTSEVLPAPSVAGDGQVTLSLQDYQRLLKMAVTQPLPPPSSYAIGQSNLNIVFHHRDGQFSATVEARLEVESFSDDWTLVPLIGPGAALESALIDGVPVQLVQRSEGLFWLAETRTRKTIELRYHVDSRHAELAYITSLPVPQAAATQFSLLIPQTGIDLAVAPAANLVINDSGQQTSATGTLPGVSTLMVSWRVVSDLDIVLTRATYTGSLQTAAQITGRESSIVWHTRIEAEQLVDGEVIVPLISSATTLVNVLVDGEPATVFTHEGRFALRLSGVGKHKIDLHFLSAVSYPEGVPSTEFDIPEVPVSSFELTLDGDKLVQVTPFSDAQARMAASVDLQHQDGKTVASFFIPVSQRLAVNWMEAIPEDIAVERRANAVVYQALHAAEGVLYGLAAIHYELTRGETQVLEFRIPGSAQVNLITSDQEAIADWVVLDNIDPQGARHIRVFLNRAVSGEFLLNVAYEQLLEDSSINDVEVANSNIEVPIIRAVDVARQKGMIALLSGTDLALAPLEHADMSEVGENQLPASFRNLLEQPVSHTYKYHSEAARLAVQTIKPERQQGKFNARIDSLISIGEVTLKGQVSIENDVKSGVLRALTLLLPADVNILGVNGPSIRNHLITPEGDKQRVDLEFTREMDGQFRIELNYERIMLDNTTEATVPRVEVVDADVEHGRIAIEALSALEVQASLAEQLSSLEINQLPRQLVLKTTNPILLAYKYVKTDVPFLLKLRITRHQEIEVQVAAIDAATYRTLFTQDGLAVTRVQFDVRNSRRQFLRLNLPAESEIWSVFVNGHAQKPAFATTQDDEGQDILIKMINSSMPFPVELVYATRGPAMGRIGHIRSSLPRPDMIVTRSQWDVYVPVTPHYKKPETNMEVLTAGVVSMPASDAGDLFTGSPDAIGGEPLHIELPTQGVLYSFSKLYANQSDQDAYFVLGYFDRSAGFLGYWSGLFAVLMIWLGIVLVSLKKTKSGSRLKGYMSWCLITAGIVLLMIAIGLLGASIVPPSILSLVIASTVIIWRLVVRWRQGQGEVT